MRLIRFGEAGEEAPGILTYDGKILDVSTFVQDYVAGRCQGLLEQLVSESGLTGHIAIIRDGESIYIDRVPSSGLIQFSSYIGVRWPLHASGVGKVLLAFMPDEELANILKYLPLNRITPHTTIVRQQLEKQLRQFRRLGYAWEVNEGEPGVACVAAPIFGDGDIAVAAVSLTGTTHQISEDRIPSLGQLVKKFANAMSSRIGSRAAEQALQV